MNRNTPTIVSCLLLVLAPLVFYWGMVFSDLEPAAADTQAHKPIGEWALQTEAREGRMPEWFPHIFSGMPSYGSFLYIPRPATNLLGQSLQLLSSNRGARYVLLLSLAGLASFAFFRRQGFSHLAATAAGLLYSLTPYVPGIVSAGHSTKLEALCLAPLVLLALDALLRRPAPWTAAFLAYAAALLAWANHPQIVYYVALVAVLYALGIWTLEARRAWLSRHGAKILAYGALVAVIALALVAVPYLAIQEYTPYSIRGGPSALAAETGEGGVGWDYATAWSYPPGELLAFLFPAWFGLQGATYWGELPFTQSTHYFGVVALGLAVLGAWRGQSRRRWIWAVVSLALLLVGFGRYFAALYRPLFEILPLFDRFRVPSMIYSLLPFTIGYLVCAGLDEVGRWFGRGSAHAEEAAGQSEVPATKKARGSRAAAVKAPGSPRPRGGSLTTRAAIALAGVLALWGLVTVGARGAHSGSDALLRPQDLARFAPEVQRALQEERMDLLVGSIAHGFTLLALVALAVLAGAWLAARRGARGSLAGALVVGAIAFLAVADVWKIGRLFYAPEARQTADELLPHPGAAAFLAKEPAPFRIFPLQPSFGSNAFVTAGLESIGGYQPAKLRVYQDLLDAGVLATPGVLRMLNVRYILSSNRLDGAGATLRYESDGFVYQLPDPTGPVWAVTRALVLPDARAVLAALEDRSFDPATVAHFQRGEATPSATEFSPAAAQLIERGLHRIRAQVDATGPALVVFSEIHYAPGWRATVDGRETPILRANHVLRAVEVPAGRHEVVLQYHSRAHDRATAANAVGVASIAILVLSGALLRRRARRSDSAHA